MKVLQSHSHATTRTTITHRLNAGRIPHLRPPGTSSARRAGSHVPTPGGPAILLVGNLLAPCRLPPPGLDSKGRGRVAPPPSRHWPSGIPVHIHVSSSASGGGLALHLSRFEAAGSYRVERRPLPGRISAHRRCHSSRQLPQLPTSSHGQRPRGAGTSAARGHLKDHNSICTYCAAFAGVLAACESRR